MKFDEKKIWLITGVSRGLGRALAEEATRQGDFVLGTVKNKSDALTFERDLGSGGKAIVLDLLHREDLPRQIEQIFDQYKKVDVLVNNAGYGLIGFFEEASEEEIKKQMEVNFLAGIQLVQLVLPKMREYRSGHIMQVSSRLGIVAAPGMGFYAASKFAMEGASEALAAEVAPFNIKVTLVEPGPMRTEFFGQSPVFTPNGINDYREAFGNMETATRERHGHQDGDPGKIARAIIAATAMEHPPLRLPLTAATMQALRQKIKEYESLLERWEVAALDTRID